MSDGTFEAYMKPVLQMEGRYSDNPNDSGGPTKYGVTQARARACGFYGDMRDLSLDTAMRIYRHYYWQQPMFDQVETIHAPLAAYMLELGINMGVAYPARFTQRALNVLNRIGKDFPDLIVDGVFGSMSRQALRVFLEKRGVEGKGVLLNMVKSQASVRYMEIAETVRGDANFEYGWQLNRAFPVDPPTVAET